jgi:carboxymethylenebutenolidase
LPGLTKQFRAYLARPRADGQGWRALRATFEAWRSAVADAVAHARRHPQVDPGRVGLVGISMGGFLAASAAAQPELRIRCVAVLFGGLPPEDRANLRWLPPTLVIHGQDDEVVPVGEAHALRELLKARGLVCEAHIYQGIGHGFVKADGEVCLWTALAAEQRTVAFLDRYLRKTVTAGKAGPALRRQGRATVRMGRWEDP